MFTGAALVMAGALVLSGCSDEDTVAGVAQDGEGSGYVAGDGALEMVPAEDRAEPVELAGTTLEGEDYDLADQRGKVVVLNVWGSWCPPCVTETPALQSVWSQFEESEEPVAFLGINYLEEAATGLAFQTSNDVTYPSLSEPDGNFFPALQGRATTTPTTLVLDPEGRIAGRVNGEISESTLRGMVEDVLSETAGASSSP